MRTSHLSRIVGIGALLFTSTLLVACGGGTAWPPETPIPSPTPIASATPTVSPTATPATGVVASASVLSFDVASPSPQPLTVSESGYAGAFTATITCTESPAGQTPATTPFVAQFGNGTATATATPASAGATVSFSVTSGSETGSCPLVVTDTNSNSATVTINVSGTAGTIFAKHRRV